MPSDWVIDDALAASIDEASRSWKQGTTFRAVPLVRLANVDKPLSRAASSASRNGRRSVTAIRESLEFGVIVTQTCDVVRRCAERPHVHIAAVVELNGQERIEAAKGWRPRYAAAEWLGPSWFVDLDRQCMVEKAVLVDCTFEGGPRSPQSDQQLARSLGRHRERYPFPDDLAPCVRPLIERLRSKAGKATAQGRRIDEIVEIRVRADPSWDSPRITIELVFLIDPARLPPTSTDEESPPLANDLSNLPNLDAQRLAELIDKSEATSLGRSMLWQRLVAEWAGTCLAGGIISGIASRAASLAEFTRGEELLTPQLDLDYLSSP